MNDSKSDRIFANTELKPKDNKKLKRFLNKSGLSKSVVTRALLRLSLDKEKELLTNENIVMLARLGKL